MGWVQEIGDLFKALKFYAIVEEYHIGLHFHSGIVFERNKRALKKSSEAQQDEKKQAEEKKDEKKVKAPAAKALTLEEVVAQEKKIIEDKGYMAFLPFRRPKLPNEFRQSRIIGQPHLKYRYIKNLPPGLYFFWPIIDWFEIYSTKIVPLNLGNISVPTIDEVPTTMIVSCNVTYKVVDPYKTLIVDNYETSLKNETMSALNKCGRGKIYGQWKKKETIDAMEKEVLAELRSTVAEKGGWGLKIYEVKITDVANCRNERVFHEGITNTVSNSVIGNENE